MNETENSAMILPVIPLRWFAVFPQLIFSFDLDKSAAMQAIELAMSENRQIFLLLQKDPFRELEPEDGDELYRVGVVASIQQLVRLPDGRARVMVEGKFRAGAVAFDASNGCIKAQYNRLEDIPDESSEEEREALIRVCRIFAFQLSRLMTEPHPDLIRGMMGKREPGYIADFFAQTLRFKPEEKQRIIEELNPVERLRIVNRLLGREAGTLEYQQELKESMQKSLSQKQREAILREQLQLIKQELGITEEDDTDSEYEEYKARIETLSASDEVKDKLKKELKKLRREAPNSAEAGVIRTYIDTVLSLPWGVSTEEVISVEKTRKVLDDDHYGLQKVKERILEFVAVRQLAPDMKGNILCLVGPPGTGKTSIGKSIAKALGRKLARISLGGIHDEAEIRGHRKTYVGAMPGRIINAVIQAGSMNPVLLLDEIDKLGSDYRGDPSAALLEALDSEQNGSFRDHYLELPFDLSQTLFITTANDSSTIPRPLLDRMELIELGSYTDEEKLHIARDHLLPKQRKLHGLKAKQIRIGDAVLRDIISGWTSESGVRMLERELAAVCRKAAVRLVESENASLTIKQSELEAYLGVRRYKPEEKREKGSVGLARGLAWTSVGGVTLDVEAAVLDGSGKLELTGNLGQVMQESAKAAYSYIRSRTKELGIEADFYKTKDIHVHFPEGATPKDGPSAGVTMTVAMISALTGAPVRANVAMTGEISLRGRVMAIGGLKEKTMAAFRVGADTVILPADNTPDLADIDADVKKALNFIPVGSIDEALHAAIEFGSAPVQSLTAEKTQ